MTTDRTFQAKNLRERDRLTALVARLNEADLQRPMGHGWTVATTLVHLAFWDFRAVELIDRYTKNGVTASPVDIDVLNDTVSRLAGAIPPRAAGRLAAEAAEAVERRIAALPDHIVEAVVAAGKPFNPARHTHWSEHLDEIERALR